MENSFSKQELINALVEYYENATAVNFEGYVDTDEIGNDICQHSKDTIDMLCDIVLAQLYYYLARDFVTLSTA